MDKKSNQPLSNYSNNVHSQFGEDGIIWEILNRFESGGVLIDFACVEFGAWDGRYLSNTCNLIENRNFKAILIESDKKKSSEILGNFSNFDVQVINTTVGTSANDSLDSILSSTNISIDFDFLSIDVDGMDFHILATIEKYRPKIICIEFNSSIPNEIEYTQVLDPRVNQGSSALSINLLAKSKGYELVAATFCNLIFVDRKYANLALCGSEAPSLMSLRNDEEYKNYIFFGYDGQMFTSKPLFTSWHQVVVSNSRIQGIPRVFRKFESNFGPIRTWLWRRYIGAKNRKDDYPKFI